MRKEPDFGRTNRSADAPTPSPKVFNTSLLAGAGVGSLIVSALALGAGHPRRQGPPPPGTTAYLVKRDETLGTILFERGISPLWGPHGWVKRISRLNEGIVRRHGDRIYPNTDIWIPTEAIASAQPLASRSPASGPVTVTPLPPPVGQPLAIAPTAPAVTTPPSLSPPQRGPQAVPTESPKQAPLPIAIALSDSLTTLNVRDLTTGANGKLQSDHDVRLAGTWLQDWSDSFSSFVRFELRSLGFEPSTNPGETLADTSQVETTFALGGQSSLGDRLSLSYAVSYGDETFLHGLSSQELTIDSVFVPAATLELTCQAVQKAHASAGLRVHGTYYGPGSTDTYSVLPGYGVGGGAYYERKIGKSGGSVLALRIDYLQRSENTSFVSVTEQAVGLGLSFSFNPFGPFGNDQGAQ